MGVLDDKVAIVTGSARGIGRATAELLSEHGAKVLINDLDGDAAAATAGDIGGETAVFAGDLTRPGVPDALIAKAIDEFGQIDIIVNNAGYTLDPQHVRRDVPADARHPCRGAVSDHPGGGSVPARAGQGRAGRGS